LGFWHCMVRQRSDGLICGALVIHRRTPVYSFEVELR
jgi:hypothetical protein